MWLVCDECHTEVMISRLTRNCIEALCPACSASMLSEDDYKIAKKAMRWNSVANWLGKLVGLFRQVETVQIHTHVKDGQVSRRILS